MKLPALLFAALSLAACAVQPLPDLPPSHPASPDAAEAPARPSGTDLGNDDATRVTRQLLGSSPASPNAE